MLTSNPYESPLADGDLSALPRRRGTDPFWVLAASGWTLFVTMLMPLLVSLPDWLWWSVLGASVLLVVMAALARPFYLLLVTAPIAAVLTFVLRVAWLGRG
jgi:hypothetical protein